MFSGGTSTPVAASKRPHTRASAAARRSQSRAGSLAPSNAGTPVPSRRGAAGVNKSSGLAGRALTASYAGSEAGAGNGGLDTEDVEGLQSQGVLLKTESHAVALLGAGLPAEVQQVLSSSDFYTDPYAATLDHENGYACLAGREQCYVWSLAQTSSTSSPTCYIFPVPSSSSSSLSLAATIFSPVPFVSFISQGGSGREPGFLLVGPTGAIRYWSSISQALSDIERCSAAGLPLTQGELVRALHQVQPNSFVLGTSGARLFSLSLTQSLSAAGVQIQTGILSRSRGMLARVGGLFGGATADPRAGILALASAKATTEGGRRAQIGGLVLFAAQDRALQTWRLGDGTETFLGEADIYEALRDAIYDSFPAPESPSAALQPEIVDMAALSSNQALLLVAYPSIRKQQKSSRAARTEYALATVSTSFSVVHVRLLSYSHEPNPTPLSTPRLHVARDSANLAFIVFPEVICLIGLQTDSFEEEVALRNPVRDRLLGAGRKSSLAISMLAASSGLLQLEVSQSYLQTEERRTANRIKDEENPEAAATRRLKNKLDQAVIFGDRSSNPLAFELRVDSTGDLVKAAESVSKEILSSTSPHLPNIIDLRAQLADRIARLRHLIVFIQENSLISRLSRTSKRHLSWDAEKLSSALALWSIQNARIATQQEQRDQPDLLSEVIEELNLDTHAEADPTRAFYRYSADSLPFALEKLLPLLRKHLTAPHATLSARSDAVYQVAQTLCATYKTTLRFRRESANVYGITDNDQTCLSEPWSSRSQLLELMRAAIEALESIIDARTREMGSNIDNETELEYGQFVSANASREREERERQKNLRDCTAELADYALAMHQERMAYLQSQSEDSSAVSELRSLLDIYVQLRSHSISLVARLGRPNVAYDLAERYRDFKSLVALCNDPQIGSTVRVGFYIDKYKQDFAFALYQYYLEQGRLHDLLTQDRMYEPLLSAFLAQADVPRLSWIQDVSCARYSSASAALLEEATRETRLAEQKLLLSLGKLAKVADLTRDQLASSEGTQREIDAVDERLDVTATHERLIELCRVTLDARDLAKPVEAQAKECVARLCGNQSEPMQSLAQALFAGLLSGRALSPEDLVDLLSLKDNDSPEQLGDYSNAVELLTRDKRTPRARLELALRAIWRRTMLHDDWAILRQSASTSSDEDLARALQDTALYATLLACGTREIDAFLLLRPAQVLYTASGDEEDAVRARFASPSEVDVYAPVSRDRVAQEYERESVILKGWVEDRQVRLEEFYDEVERLVMLQLQRGEGDAGQSNILDDSMIQ